jgi:acetyltransferase-like isoleucine patch superfamily enzyme
MKLNKVLQQILAYSFGFLLKHNLYYNINSLIERKLLFIGRYTYGNPIIDIYKGSEAKVIIGNFCSISKEVVIITGGIHPANWVSMYPFRINWGLPNAYKDGMPSTHGDIIIGSDVWIGTGATILSGITIGHGAIIAARSVVTSDIPPYAFAAGIPAKVIRFRFNGPTIEKLLEIKWWNWNDDEIREAIPLLSSSNLEEFFKKYG